ncbi:DUF2541 family protein [Shewanella youngdeokensis]|uniref:DUF2541 family protein n=1 Tax=Shewanella youngdeokensis TaxID=2999068 RepID=A0ABZ0JZQ6_9GAMM|nr:DUF2541 family protein [Shewanella sp. DAU334]
MLSLHKTLRTTLLMAVMLVFAMPVSAAQWEMLGTRTVKRNLDKDVMQVSIAEGGFRQIKITVKRSPVNIKRIIVQYANGSLDELKVRSVIAAGGETRLLDLRGGKRAIRNITFFYETIEKGRGKSIVTAWGRRGV